MNLRIADGQPQLSREQVAVNKVASKKPKKQSYGLSDYYSLAGDHRDAATLYAKMIAKLEKRLEGRHILLSLDSMIAKLDGAKEQWEVNVICRAWDDGGEARVECNAT